jgi:hypothetical protein
VIARATPSHRPFAARCQGVLVINCPDGIFERSAFMADPHAAEWFHRPINVCPAQGLRCAPEHIGLRAIKAYSWSQGVRR